MKKKQRLAIDDALNSALKPPPTRRPSENLNSLLSQYAPTTENVSPPVVPHDGIPPHGTPRESTPAEGIPSRGTPGAKSAAVAEKQRDTDEQVEAGAERGYYPTFNDLDDRIIPEHKLDTFEQSVLRRLYRLSRGFKSHECEVGLGALSKACNISRSRIQKTINSLLARGLIHSLGQSQSGTRYRVLEQLPGIPQRGIPQKGIPQGDAGIPWESSQGIPQRGNIKKNKDILNTHTKRRVGVGSNFSLEECRRYAEHLRVTGQGITNPGGYAMTIHRTGEADELLERFLRQASNERPLLDTSACPDCQGTGFYYPEGKTGGVMKCSHSRLRK